MTIKSSINHHTLHTLTVLICALGISYAPHTMATKIPSNSYQPYQLSPSVPVIVHTPSPTVFTPGTNYFSYSHPFYSQENTLSLKKLVTTMQRYPLTSLLIGSGTVLGTYVLANYIYQTFTTSLIRNAPEALKSPVANLKTGNPTIQNNPNAIARATSIKDDVDSWTKSSILQTTGRCITRYGLYDPLVSRIYRTALVDALNDNNNPDRTTTTEWSTNWSGNYFIYRPNTTQIDSSEFSEKIYIDETKGGGTVATLKNLIDGATHNGYTNFEIYVYHTLAQHTSISPEYTTDRTTSTTINNNGEASVTTGSIRRHVGNIRTTTNPIELYIRPQDMFTIKSFLGNFVTIPKIKHTKV